MAKLLTKFLLEDGTPVLMETPTDGGGDQRFANDDEVRTANKSFEAVVSRIRPAAEAVLKSLREMNTPKEVELEFGVAFSATAGVIFATADSEINFKVKLKWENVAR